MTFEIKFLSFMTKVNPSNEIKMKSDIFPWDTFKSDIISYWPQKTKIFERLLYLAFFNFFAKLNTNN